MRFASAYNRYSESQITQRSSKHHFQTARDGIAIATGEISFAFFFISFIFFLLDFVQSIGTGKSHTAHKCCTCVASVCQLRKEREDMKTRAKETRAERKHRSSGGQLSANTMLPNSISTRSERERERERAAGLFFFQEKRITSRQD